MSPLKTIFAGIGAIAASMLAAANAAVLVGVQGQFYAVDAPILNVTAAEAIIASRSVADATWTVSAIDYPNGSDVISDSSSLMQLLGADAASLSADFSTLGTSVFRFVGEIFFNGTETSFAVGSDDGFVLRIGSNEIARFEGERNFGVTSGALSVPAGLYTFELVYFENGGETGVSFAIDQATVLAGDPPAPIPLPAAALFMATGLGTLILRRKKKA